MSIESEIAELHRALATAREQTRQTVEVLEEHKRRTGLRIRELEEQRDALQARIDLLERVGAALGGDRPS